MTVAELDLELGNRGGATTKLLERRVATGREELLYFGIETAGGSV